MKQVKLFSFILFVFALSTSSLFAQQGKGKEKNKEKNKMEVVHPTNKRMDDMHKGEGKGRRNSKQSKDAN